jgi:hypothetical protein
MNLIKSFNVSNITQFSVGLDLSKIMNADVIVSFMAMETDYTEVVIHHAYVNSKAPVLIQNNADAFPSNSCMVKVAVTPIGQPQAPIYEELTEVLTA